MENEKTAAVVAPGEELCRELEALRADLRNGIAGIRSDLSMLQHDMKWLNSQVVSVRRDIHYLRLFSLQDMSEIRRSLDRVRERLDRGIELRRALDDLAGRITRLERAEGRASRGQALDVV